MHVTRRTPFAVTVAVTVLSLFASSCGDSETDPTTTGSDDTSTPARELIEHPSEADTAVVRIAVGQPHPGSIPDLVIGGDGKMYEPGEKLGEDGGGLRGVAPPQAGAQPVIVRQLSSEGMQLILQRADELGLLADPPTYEDTAVTDSATTYVRFDADGSRFDHEAYALGFDDPEIDEERRRLADFVTDLEDVEALVGSGNIGPPDQHVPELWSVSAGVAYPPFDDEAQRWPKGIEVTEGCVELDVAEFPGAIAGRYLVGADTERVQLVAVSPDLPGDDC